MTWCQIAASTASAARPGSARDEWIRVRFRRSRRRECRKRAGSESTARGSKVAARAGRSYSVAVCRLRSHLHSIVRGALRRAAFSTIFGFRVVWDHPSPRRRNLHHPRSCFFVRTSTAVLIDRYVMLNFSVVLPHPIKFSLFSLVDSLLRLRDSLFPVSRA